MIMGEVVKNFYNCIIELDEYTYLENHLKYTLSPVIREVKPSITMTITTHKNLIEKWNRYGDRILKRLGLRWAILRKTKAGSILLIYKPSLVEETLEPLEVRVFLMQLGYQFFEAEEAVNHLVARYNQYHCPHELGIFLGIPLEDVKDFMSCDEKKCLFCGYWKVYNNLEYALETFKAYDDAKKEMLYELIEELQIAL